MGKIRPTNLINGSISLIGINKLKLYKLRNIGYKIGKKGLLER